MKEEMISPSLTQLSSFQQLQQIAGQLHYLPGEVIEPYTDSGQDTINLTIGSVVKGRLT